MKTFARLALGATLSLALVACASPSGQPWTPPPAPTETEAPASQAPSSAAPESAAPESAAPESPGPVTSEAPAEARTIDLEYTADLKILLDGAQIKDIPVTPGETVTFRITNNAGFAHNFWIGPNSSLMLGQTDGLVGHAEWADATPVEVTWTVPADITGLKFGCTVPGHFASMNGTFSLASAGPTSVPGTQAPASVEPSVAPSAGTSQDPVAGRVIELELTAALEIKQGGAKVVEIPVTPGETIVFRITNTAGYIHNFWIGPDSALMSNQTAGLTGIPDWTDAEPRELTWVVPDDITGLFYGCTVPGHYTLMKGIFTLAQ